MPQGTVVLRRPEGLPGQGKPRSPPPHNPTGMQMAELTRYENFRLFDDIRVDVSYVHPSKKIICVQLQRCSVILAACMKKCEELNQDKAFHPFPPKDIVVGTLCCAKYSEDDLYYRAAIASVNLADQTCELLFIDYGNVEQVSFDQVLTFDAALAVFPILAIPVFLEMIDGKADYTVEEMEALGDNIEGGYTMKMIRRAIDVGSDPDEFQPHDFKFVVDIITKTTPVTGATLPIPAGSSSPVAPIAQSEPESVRATATSPAVPATIPAESVVNNTPEVKSPPACSSPPANVEARTNSPVGAENAEIPATMKDSGSGDRVPRSPSPLIDLAVNDTRPTAVIAPSTPTRSPERITSPPTNANANGNGNRSPGSGSPGNSPGPSLAELSNAAAAARFNGQWNGNVGNGNGNGNGNTNGYNSSCSGSSGSTTSTSGSGCQFHYHHPTQPYVIPLPEAINLIGIPMTNGAMQMPMPMPGYPVYNGNQRISPPRSPPQQQQGMGQFQLASLTARMNELIGYFEAVKSWTTSGGPEGPRAGAGLTIPMHHVPFLIPALLDSLKDKQEKIAELEKELAEIKQAAKARAKNQFRGIVGGQGQGQGHANIQGQGQGQV